MFFETTGYVSIPTTTTYYLNVRIDSVNYVNNGSYWGYSSSTNDNFYAVRLG